MSGAPHFECVIIRGCDKHFRVHWVKSNAVDNIGVWVGSQTNTVVAVPKVTMLVLGTTDRVENTL